MTTYGVLDPQVIRAALKAQLLVKLQGWATVYENDVESPTGRYVALMAGAPYLLYHVTFGVIGIAQMNLVLELGIGGAGAIGKQIQIDDMLGIGTPHSILDALTADLTLGDVVQTVGIGDPTGPTAADPFGRLPLEILARKGGNS